MSLPPTSTSCAPGSTVGSSSPDTSSAPPGSKRCAIHQPNLFPRLSTLAKLFAADCWVVLDDVQFARRDYQHRARLARLDAPHARQWLSLPTHLPNGQPTLISEGRLVEPLKSRRRVAERVRQHYGHSTHWKAVQAALEPVLDRFGTTDRTADIAESSALALLASVGWQGEVVRSSDLPARAGRSQRLADLAAAVGSGAYLCGTGGMRYLDAEPFATLGIVVVPFRLPGASLSDIWRSAREVSALWSLATIGPERLAEELRVSGPFRAPW
ncbi:WbqC family protein [Streptomyces yunnanensis]|uniref:WbqC family protein n=1 Tax=Streptomyces yunnanensis TaxID=156453 RepID=UPI0009A11290